MKITFLGATGTVTGSKYLLTAQSEKILIDCGLFQGYKPLRLRNWSTLPICPSDLSSVVLTHAHIDHSGYLPLLVKNGFRGKIYCSESTYELCKILLPDSGRLLEEEANYANRHGFSKHRPALPLYSEADAVRSLKYFSPVKFGRPFKVGTHFLAEIMPAGHILGAAIVKLRSQETTITFSGDLGRFHDNVMAPPNYIDQTDYLVVESTYGNRIHDPTNPCILLGKIIRETVSRGGVTLIPSFAVGRAQMLIYYLYLLQQSGEIPASLPIYLNSPMAAKVTEIYRRHRQDHRLTDMQCKAIDETIRIVNSVEESIALNQRRTPMVIIAASGMATGGRVLHHLKAFAPNPRNTILFAGFQAGGTRGAAMINGAEAIKIHGEYVPIRAQVAHIDNLSAHADKQEILSWLSHFSQPPKKTFITHGEMVASDTLRQAVEEQLHWCCCIPEYLESAELS